MPYPASKMKGKEDIIPLMGGNYAPELYARLLTSDIYLCGAEHTHLGHT